MRIVVRFCWYCALILVVAVGALEAPSASNGSCANAQLRTGYSAHLPDCRAYELVTPPGSAAPTAPLYLTTLLYPYSLPEGNLQVEAAVGGDGLAYFSEEANSQSMGLVDLARRGPEGWSSENVIPRQSVEDGICIASDVVASWSLDLSRGVLTEGYDALSEGEPARCSRDEPELVPGEPHGIYTNLFVRDTATASFQLVNVTPSAVSPAEAIFDDGSADMSHVVFDENAQLTANAPSGDELYEWSSGKVYLVTVLPDGTAAQGQLAGAVTKEPGYPPWQTGDLSHAVSADGSRIFFQAGGNLYLRENGGQEPGEECSGPVSACTVQLDATQEGSGSSGGGRFGWASANGSKVFFTDESRLTRDSTAQAGRPDLYEYDLEAPEGQHLRDVTVNGGEPADVLGVSGASEDGSYLYFVADGVLAGGQNGHAMAQAGKPNLYLSHGGETAFIATLDGESSDACDWTASCLTARVSSNGLFIAFDSVASLTGYDNAPANPNDCSYTLGLPLRPGAPCIEIFRYNAGAGELDCASCDPNGAPASASATIRTPGKTAFYKAQSEYLSRNVSNRGQVFFDTSDVLLPAAANGQGNVYEYDDTGLHLISSGTSSESSYLFDATPDGSNVFFITEQQLLRQDTSADYAIYDARVGGGFPYVPPGAPCGGEACIGTVRGASVLATPGSVSFTGPNQRPAAPPTTLGRLTTLRQQLARVLVACKRRRDKHARALCERKARQRYSDKSAGRNVVLGQA